MFNLYIKMKFILMNPCTGYFYSYITFMLRTNLHCYHKSPEKINEKRNMNITSENKVNVNGSD